MGVISDFVIAHPSEAAVVIEEPAPARKWKGLEAKSIDTVKLSTLKFILDGKDLDTEHVVSYSMGVKELAMKGDEGPWVYLVPEELVQQLAERPKAGLAAVAKRWHQTEEFKLDGWNESDVLEVLEGLHELAIGARSTKRSMLLFMSL